MTNNLPLLQDILNQPHSLARTVDYHFGAGQSALHDAAKMINGRRILLSGMGSSLYACYKLSVDLAAHGLTAAVIGTAELLHYHHHAYRDAVAVLVSRSGESIETIKSLPLLKAQGTRIVGVTDAAESALAREADVVVLIHGGKDQQVAVQSYTATLMALHLLGAVIIDSSRDGSRAVGMSGVGDRPAGSQFDAARRELDAVSSLLADYVPSCIESSRVWRSFFNGAHVIHLLGRGYSMASISEGALLFNEVAKFPAVPMEAAQFRHGPVEIVDESYRAIIFAPDDHARELNIALARDLSRLGGQTRLIGPPEANEMWWPTPIVPASLAPALEIIPIQCAAMRWAAWRGFTPGEFRVATQVTRSEAGFG